MTIEITPDVAQLVQGIYAEGQYASESEVVAAAVQLLHARQQLRKDLAIGRQELEAGRRLAADEVFAGLRERARALDEAGTGK